MASAWGDSWASAWGDSWGAITSDPNALRGTAAGSSTAGATLSAIAWIAGSSAGSSTAQAYLELDGGQPAPPFAGGTPRPRVYLAPAFAPMPKRRTDDAEALLLTGCL